ncbi:two-component sensor histidine kinase [Rhodoferax lacus]|uniref:histidine kinase n=1 Tax=Rhodoferax lacus TaxID=2184758 RepID=A0A3E1RAE0_9BURK|nr:HAMP domain-containing sensor histidine kinase [Rhodoferax lacus]RFO96191.1 two-component sensor histidine kinase [Rhodoferax lacus]
MSWLRHSRDALAHPRRALAQSRHALAHSLRVRLVALFVLLALAMAATFAVGMQAALSIGWRDAARPLVMDYVDKLAAEIGSPPSTERAQVLVDRLPLRIRISGPVVNWRSSPNQPERGQPSGDSGRWNRDGVGDGPEEHLLERRSADGHRIQFGLSVAAWRDRPRFIGWTTLALLLLFTALAYKRVRRLLRPLDDIRAGALRFGAGDFAQAIAVPHPKRLDELGELAATINTMASDIQQMLDAKRSLLLAISHELRSPLTRARLNTELLPETAELQASRDALLRDLALMRDLVTDLLESERLSSRHAALHCEPVDLKALAEEVALGLDHPVQLDLAADLPTLQLDVTRMRLLLRNLLDNALRHSGEASLAPLLRVLAQEAGGVEISVRDFGAGVSPEQLSQLAQPFYRPDSARTREGGGVGLGLYLCKLVAEAHGGSLAIGNANPGLVVTVRLPAG